MLLFIISIPPWVFIISPIFSKPPSLSLIPCSVLPIILYLTNRYFTYYAENPIASLQHQISPFGAKRMKQAWREGIKVKVKTRIELMTNCSEVVLYELINRAYVFLSCMVWPIYLRLDFSAGSSFAPKSETVWKNFVSPSVLSSPCHLEESQWNQFPLLREKKGFCFQAQVSVLLHLPHHFHLSPDQVYTLNLITSDITDAPIFQVLSLPCLFFWRCYPQLCMCMAKVKMKLKKITK